jgi:uncharacterized protein (TIGR03083 family)
VLEPILTAHLFPTLDARLIDLLRSLAADDWERQTIAQRWNVKDVAAHLLDTQLRTLSFGRDGYTPSPDPAIASDRDLVPFIDRLNAEGVTVYRRLSPPVLIALIERTSREAASYYASLDPFAPARFAVSWAGESVSANWFDVARELTERWHHQQQIRLAVADAADAVQGRSENAARNLRAITTAELYHPVLDCFMRALPFHYRSISAPPGSAIRIHVSGDCGGEWHLFRGDTWMQAREAGGTIVATATIPQDIAWRVFTKGISREHARELVRVTGDAALGNHVLNMLAIVG